MTLYELLTEGTAKLNDSGIADAALDARTLLLEAFQSDMTHFLLNRMQKLPETEETAKKAETYREMIRKREDRRPLQQILGCTEFMGLPFYVNEHVLIPRQDTETLVELVLEDLRREKRKVGRNSAEKPELLDVCTGSGCIALSLAASGEFSKVTAVDLSEEALKVAGRNADRLLAPAAEDRKELFGEECSPERISRDGFFLYQGDLYGALPENSVPFDVITSNPPYIPTAVIAGLEPEVRVHEPMMALDGSEDGLLFYRRLAAESAAHLKKDGRIYLEIGYDQGEAVSELFRAKHYRDVRVCKDLAGNDRVVIAVRPEP